MDRPIHQPIPYSANAGNTLVLLNTVEKLATGEEWLVNATIRQTGSNTYLDEFFLVDKKGNARIMGEGCSAHFSPDGSMIAYERHDLSHTTLWIYDIHTKTHRQVAVIYSSEYFLGHMAEKNFTWSPDSQHIAYISAEPFDNHIDPPQQTITRLLYKTKGGRGRNRFADNRLSHIWIVATKTNSEPVCLTPGTFNEHSISWSLDGKHIAFISNRDADPDRAHRNDLLMVNVENREITTLVSGKGTRFKPQWSPGGDHIAYLADDSAFTSKDSPAPDVQVYICKVKNKASRCLTASLDRRTDNISWNIAGTRLMFTTGDHGCTVLYSIDIDTGKISELIHEKCLIKSYCGDDEKIVYIANTIDNPDELYIKEGNDIRRLAAFNDELRKRFIFSGAETFWFNASDGIQVQGWLMQPVNFNAGSKYPLVLVIHGGPHNMFGYEFDERMQMLCAAGYGVVYFNPRGSSGYGQEFTNGNLMNWGGRDYEDIMEGITHVLKSYIWIDSNRLGVTGQSYGGYLTNWIITQTNMFRAAISDGGISNLISFAGTSLYHCLIEAEFGGNTWNNYSLLWKWSPLQYVQSVQTPTLFLHGETDNEVPVTQSEEMFSALKRSGVETTFVRYQNEGHGWRPDMLPQNRIDTYHRMIDWFDRHIK